MHGWMATPERGEARPRRRWRLLPLALVTLCALHFSALGAAEEPTVEPAEYAGGFAWRPASLEVTPGATVSFRNPSKIVPHGVAWTQGAPSCSGVPVGGSGTDWSGTCTFAQAGTYTFVCTVHPEEMKGTITVGSGEGAPPPGSGYGETPTETGARAYKALQVAKNQQGVAVNGSLTIFPGAAGSRLAVELLATRASLGIAGKGVAQVGKKTRTHLKAGRQTFAVPLRASAQRALQERGRLSLTVKVAVSSPTGSRETATRRVELHG